MRPRRLGLVADDRPAGVAAATAEHPPLHGREVLGLVDQDVGEAVVLDALGRAEAVDSLFPFAPLEAVSCFGRIIVLAAGLRQAHR
ncbi:hypothetical protein [Aeromicrobium sp. UC242_57]|uniref:hypothetical protein n=1 Tax=Aeromicrobium sp. UC242_57 TaxID=3374624 RepID=UPI00378DFE3E